jgi:hypothetical protein
MRVFVTDRKVQRMRRMAQEILLSALRNWLLVAVAKLRHFCYVAVLFDVGAADGRFLHPKSLLGYEPSRI